MHTLDWIILVLTLLFIVVYGVYKTRGSRNVEEYILANNNTPWWTVGLSVMATQASAITFLSTPGQAYHDGMGFVQFYFGLPLAMVVISLTFIPIFQRLKVFTAYEFLEKRFDLRTRSLAAIIFLIQRGLGTGLTIYAPAIILSTLLGWDLNLLILIIGIVVIFYTTIGGTKAVNVTQKQQMFVIMTGMFIIFGLIISYLPNEMAFTDALQLAGANNKMNIIDLSYNPETRYTLWSGITGGFFLMLAYFGTDQSQVGRYLSGKSVRESQMGLIMNGFLKVPMQFFILLIGVMVFVFFQFNSSPLNFNPNNKKAVMQTEYAGQYLQLEQKLEQLSQEKKQANLLYIDHLHQGYDNLVLRKELAHIGQRETQLREQAKELLKQANPTIEPNDKDYVFIHFIVNYLPKGIVGILLAVILSAAMSATASGLSALANTTSIDLYKRNIKTPKSDHHYVFATRVFTVLWGIIAIGFACFGTLFENLIQLVNIIGSIFYPTVLGIFIVAFYCKKIEANATFYSALATQIGIFFLYGLANVSFLWLNFIGTVAVVGLAYLFQYSGLFPPRAKNENQVVTNE